MTGSVYEGFDAVEALQESSEAAGWDIEYRQIEQGRLVAATRSRQIGDLPLMVESANLRLEVAGTTPDGIVTVLVPGPSTNLSVNGNRLAGDRILVLGPGTEMHTISGRNSEVASIHVPQPMLVGHAECLLDRSREFSIHSGLSVEAGPMVRQLHDALLAAIHDDRDSAPVRGAGTPLVSWVLSLIESGQAQRRTRSKYGHLDNRRVLKRALDYIDGSLNCKVRIPVLCAYAGASLSTLERLFQREYQQPPSAYIRSRRLDAARRALQHSNAVEPIANVALDHGFQHLGRFAADYRRQFGVLPSEDRRL